MVLLKKKTISLFYYPIVSLALGAFVSCTTPQKYEQHIPPISKTETAPHTHQEIDNVIEKTMPSEADASNKETAENPDSNTITDPTDEISNITLENVPPEMSKSVDRWIHFFTERSPDRMKRYLERGERYKPMILKILKDQGLPENLYYLALIESGFTTSATSRAQAVGVWQFIRGTARHYGLRVDRHVDERRDPIRATIAASLYLNDLHNVFQSWYLAMAAYNAGEGRIVRAIMGGNSRNFWTLVKNKKLPKETMHYIPKFIAAVIVGSNPEKYGITNIKSEPYPTLVSVTVPSPIKTRRLASVTGVPYSIIKKHNPQIRSSFTPPDKGTYRIWLPKNYAPQAEAKKDKLNKYVLTSLKRRTYARNLPGTHKIRRGETLATIARRYRISVSTLKRLNNLRSNRIIAGKRLVISKSKSKKIASTKKRSIRNVKRYKVRRGDSLHSISKRFGLSIREIKNLNRLRHNRIYAGQTLKVRSRG